MNTPTLAGLCGVFLSLGVAVLAWLRPRRPALSDTIAGRGERHHSAVHRHLLDRTARATERFDRSHQIREWLRASGVTREPSEVIRLCGFGAAGTVAIIWLLLGPTAAAAVALLLPPSLALVARRRRATRQHEFASALPDALALFAGALTSGHSTDSSLTVVARRARGAVGEEWARAVGESRLGVDLLDALQRAADRMASQELAWVVLVLRINREVGGDLASVLETVTATMRSRDRQRRRVRALTAEARLSAVILCALPLVFAAYLAVVRPEYLSLLATSALGAALSAVAITLLVAGVWWMRLLIRDEAT